MTFHGRMLVGVEVITVWRYLLEKVAHTALLTLVLYVLGDDRLSLVWHATIAAAGYLVIGKWWWHATHPADPWSWRDFAYDGLVGASVVVIVFARVNLLAALVCAVLWTVAFLGVDNARWGSPS